MINYFSICSGVEAATVAWHPFGWRAVGYSEIEPFACAVLAERFGSNLPGEPLSRNAPPNFGDFTTIDAAALPRIDLLVGGTPCQAFSFAGNRLSLADARGNLTLAFAVLAHEFARSNGLKNALWENVPGVLSTDDNAFGCFLGAIVGSDHAIDLPKGVKRWPDAGMVAGPRARLAWRVLDAQFFGLPQRRERVFVVVDFGNGADPAEVLFEPKGVRGNFAPRREAGQSVADTLSARTLGGGGLGTDFELDGGLVADIAGTLTAGGNSTGGDRFPGISVDTADSYLIVAPDVAATLTRDAESQGKGGYAGRRQEDDVNLVVCAYDLRGREGGAQFEGPHDTANIRAASGGSSRSYVQQGYAVRRLMPHECARLQGFPDHHSRIAWRGKPAEACPDGPQYKTYGNSMAVKVMAWLGERIERAMPR